MVATKFPTKLRSAGDIARLLLLNGADPSASTAEARTPLHSLAHYQDVDKFSDVARLAGELVTKGANTNTKATATLSADIDVASITFLRDTRCKLLHDRYAWGSKNHEYG